MDISLYLINCGHFSKNCSNSKLELKAFFESFLIKNFFFVYFIIFSDPFFLCKIVSTYIPILTFFGNFGDKYNIKDCLRSKFICFTASVGNSFNPEDSLTSIPVQPIFV